MKKRLRKLIWHVLKKWVLAQPTSGFIFTRGIDGKEVDVAFCGCNACKNYFWTQNVEVQVPSYCPFCGQQFEIVVPVSDEEARDTEVF